MDYNYMAVYANSKFPTYARVQFHFGQLLAVSDMIINTTHKHAFFSHSNGSIIPFYQIIFKK